MKCEIIRDLLPVYCDGLASEETCAEVEQHIADCVECRERLQLMKEAVPEVPEPDIEPLKKVKRTLRLRLALLIGLICLGVFGGLYNLLCLHPLAARSDSLTVEHFSRRNDGTRIYSYRLHGKLGYNPGHGDSYGLVIPPDSEFIIDEKNDCVWLNGEKAVAGESNGETVYVPADGILDTGGVLCLNIKCDTLLNCVRCEYENPTPGIRPDASRPVDHTLTLRPCLPFRQDMTCTTSEDTVFRMEYAAGGCAAGAKLTVKCRDKDMVIDLHKLAVEEGLFEE